MLNDDSMIGPQDSILFHQIRDHVLQVPTEPAGEGGQKDRSSNVMVFHLAAFARMTIDAPCDHLE